MRILTARPGWEGHQPWWLGAWVDGSVMEHMGQIYEGCDMEPMMRRFCSGM